ncbi:uncharacterized protein LOC117110956, partial [Anneissia japonica]|uniref:uncharacterized protein LOC117110956 n=1 Tax=Anneissia japonica TaxID=1529436 RepID=UPI001425B0DD
MLPSFNDESLASSLNNFYTRFDDRNFDKENITFCRNLNSENCPVNITVEEVIKLFRKTKIRKAAGPDGLAGILIRECATQIAPVFQYIFQLSLRQCVIPSIWKHSLIIPIPKSSTVSNLNDYRPIALTSLIMKCLERFVVNQIKPVKEPKLDPMQFAYRAHRGVEDATATLVHYTKKHLETSNSYARLLFIDFSSAFNTLQSHVLLPKLLKFGLCSLTLAVIVYTNDCRTLTENCMAIKYADDTVLVSLNNGPQSLNNYLNDVTYFSNWCKNHFLKINLKKTCELIIDFRKKNRSDREPLNIDGEQIKVVPEYKYLGTVIDEKYEWSSNTLRLYKKDQQRLHMLRQLRKFNVDKEILEIFYQSMILSVISFCRIIWEASLYEKDKGLLAKITKRAGRAIGVDSSKLNLKYNAGVLSM